MRNLRRRRGPRGDVAVVALATLLVGGLLGLGALGVRPLVITSGSMTPTLRVGDLVVSRSVTPDRLRPGQIVSFRSAVFRGELVTHRVVRTSRTADLVVVETRGDANNASETWSVPATSKVGIAVTRIRRVGWWFAAVNTRPGHVAVLLVALSGVAVMALSRVWAPRPSRTRRPSGTRRPAPRGRGPAPRGRGPAPRGRRPVPRGRRPGPRSGTELRPRVRR